MNLELGVVGNCEIAALVDESARIVWACLPRLDGDPVFCSLLMPEGGDAAKGVFAVEMQHGARSTQRYLRNTAILETLLDDGAGNVLRVTDFCPRFRRRGRFFRPMMIVRIVEAAAGRPVARLRLRPIDSLAQLSFQLAPQLFKPFAQTPRRKAIVSIVIGDRI